MRTKPKSLIIVLCISIAVVAAYAPHWREVTSKELITYLQSPKTANDLVFGAYYCGSANGYHYFIVERRWPLTSTRFRVKSSALTLKATMPYSRHSARWVEPFTVIEITNSASQWGGLLN